MLSKRTLLCVEILLTMARSGERALVTAKNLSQRLSTSVSHIECMMCTLKKAGLVQSVRGPGGGYCLAKASSQISIWDVVVGANPAAVQASSSPPSSPLTHWLEAAYFSTFKDHLAAHFINEFVGEIDPAMPAHTPARSGFQLGPMPEQLRPFAPNSVFQLSSFMQMAAA